MKAMLREKVLKLRAEEELSYSEIRQRVKVSRSTLSYWLREFPLSEEKILELRRKGWEKGEAARERFRATMLKKKEERALEIYRRQKERLKNLSKEACYVGGLMLYLGEGDKKNPNRVGLANTDPGVMVFFSKWLTDFLGVSREQMKVELHLYDNMHIEKEKKYWEEVLGLAKSQFYKSQIRKLKKESFSYRESFWHGTCTIIVNSSSKKKEIMMAIKALLDTYKEMRA